MQNYEFCIAVSFNCFAIGHHNMMSRIIFVGVGSNIEISVRNL